MVHAAWPSRHICQLSLIGLAGGQQIVTRHAFEAPGVVDATLINDTLRMAWAASVRADWRTNMLTLFRAAQSIQYSLTLIRVQVVEATGLFEHRLVGQDDGAGLPLAGTFADNLGPLTTCGVIRWRSATAGRHQRGRSYFVTPQTQMIGGQLQAAYATALAAYGNALVVRYGANAPTFADATLTVYSRPFNNNYYVKRVGGVPEVQHQIDYAGNSTNVTAAAVDPTARSQRRREVGRGA